MRKQLAQYVPYILLLAIIGIAIGLPVYEMFFAHIPFSQRSKPADFMMAWAILIPSFLLLEALARWGMQPDIMSLSAEESLRILLENLLRPDEPPKKRIYKAIVIGFIGAFAMVVLGWEFQFEFE